jgi:hypothetical protein
MDKQLATVPPALAVALPSARSFTRTFGPTGIKAFRTYLELNTFYFLLPF